MNEETALATKDADLCKHIRETYDRFVKRWQPIFKEGELDMKCLSIDGPISKADRDARSNPDTGIRPCEHFDIVSQQNKRVVNQARMNKRGIKITPEGNGANDKTAQLRESRIRRIEYETKAGRARMTAFQNAVDRGVGVYEISTKYVNPESHNLKIVYERIPNPVSVLMDPDAIEADFSDAQEAFRLYRYTHERFRREFPDAEIKSFTREHMGMATGWIDDQSVMVAAYWRVEKKKVRLLTIDRDPKPVMEDVLQKRYPGAVAGKDEIVVDGQHIRITKQRESERCKVLKRYTNGLEILDTIEWTGSTIPLILVIGLEKWIDGERDIESLTRKQRSAQLAYDMAANGEIEALGMVALSKWVIADGQLEGFEDEWQFANKTVRAYLRYRAQIEASGDKLLPAPQRIDFAPNIEAYEMAKDSALRAVQNAVGMTSAERVDRVAKSGVAQDKLDESADIASYHFTDNFDISIEYDGRIVNELLDRIEDSEREVGTSKEDGSYEVVKIAPKVDEEGNVVEHPYGDGTSHSVTISTGPAFESQRAAAQETANALLKNEAAFPLVGWLAIKLLDLGPLGDKMSDLLKLLLPAEARAMAEDGKQPEMSPQAIQAIQQSQQQLQQLGAYVKQLQQENVQLEEAAKGKALDAASKEKIAAMNADLAKFQALIDLKIAVLDAQTKGFVATEQLSSEENLQAAQLEAEREIQELSHQHEAGLAASQALQDGQMQEAEHEQQQSLAQQQQAAAAEQAASQSQGE